MFWNWDVSLLRNNRRHSGWSWRKKKTALGDKVTGFAKIRPVREVIDRPWLWQTACACYMGWLLMLATKNTTHWNMTIMSPREASCMVRFNSKHYLIAWSTCKNSMYVTSIEPEFPRWLYKGRENEEKVKVIRKNYKKVIRNSSKRKWTNCFKVT